MLLVLFILSVFWRSLTSRDEHRYQGEDIKVREEIQWFEDDLNYTLRKFKELHITIRIKNYFLN